MATVQQANTYNLVRGNEDWADLQQDTPRAIALLEDAEAYIRGTYSLRSTFTPSEQAMFDGVVCRLAAIFQTNPPQGAALASIKSEKKEGAGFKKEVEYNAAPADPYPYITAVLRSLLAPTTVGSAVMARLVR